MDLQEFARIVGIGLGRAVLHIQAHDPAPYREVILEACLHDTRYDQQVEPHREQYLFDLVQLSGNPGFYRERLLDSLSTVRALHDRRQIGALIRLFAQQGDFQARRRLYEAYDASAEWDCSLRDEIVALDGTAGLLFVAKRLRLHPGSGIVYLHLIETAEGRDGSGTTARALAVAAMTDPHVATFVADALAADLPDPEFARRVQDGRLQDAADYGRVRERLQAGDKWGWVLLQQWFASASEDELIQPATDLLTETHPDRLCTYLGQFWRRRFPLDPAPIIALISSPDDRVSHCAIGALTHVRTPAARQIALDLLAKRDHRGAMLLVGNYEPGDYALLERLIWSWEDTGAVDMLGMHLHEVVGAHPSLEAIPALLALYERGPYSDRRRDTIRLLQELSPLPAWLRTECRWDANPEIRAMVDK